MTLKNGDHLGLYRIEGLLGTGGMGEVYRAWDPRLDRHVAIKVLPRHATDPETVKRFEIEAKAVAALSHPSILVIHDFGSHRRMHYTVTELLEGETLKSRLSQGHLTWQGSVRIALAIAEGLQAAHAKGVVHRDLKPSNIFLTRENRIKILDFGLAFFDMHLNPSAPATRPTPPGTVIGTSGYMSPEQFMGEEVDHRTDIFSFGCVLYEMLSGKKAFQFRSIAEAVLAVLENDPAPLRYQAGEGPPELEKVVFQCLAKEPRARFQSIAEIDQALRELDPGSGPREGLGSERRPSQTRRIEALAVLPFENLGGREDSEYLSDGLAEAILRGMARLAAFRVIAWGTTSRYRGTDLLPSEIGRTLAVDAILIGRVLDRDSRLTVSVELVRCDGNEHLWGETFDFLFTKVFQFQEEITRRVADYLSRGVDIKKEGVTEKTRNAGAFRLYLRGRYFWNRRTRESLEQSQAAFSSALENDPDFALAHAGLADVYNVMPFWGLASPREAFPEAQKAARRALELEADLAAARASMAYTQFYYHWDWSAAARSFHEALEIEPGYATAHHWYGVCAALKGNFDLAFRELREARELDPLSLIINVDLALAWYLCGRSDRTLELCREAEELESSFAPVHLYRGLALERLGRFGEAIESLERAVRLTQRSSPSLAGLAYVSARAGRQDQAASLLAELRRLSKTRYVSRYPMTVAYWGLGDEEAARASLQEARRERCEMMTWLQTDPRLDDLRLKPWAKELLAGLA